MVFTTSSPNSELWVALSHSMIRPGFLLENAGEEGRQARHGTFFRASQAVMTPLRESKLRSSGSRWLRKVSPPSAAGSGSPA